MKKDWASLEDAIRTELQSGKYRNAAEFLTTAFAQQLMVFYGERVRKVAEQVWKDDEDAREGLGL